jgi:hypothetical protein
MAGYWHITNKAAHMRVDSRGQLAYRTSRLFQNFEFRHPKKTELEVRIVKYRTISAYCAMIIPLPPP